MKKRSTSETNASKLNWASRKAVTSSDDENRAEADLDSFASSSNSTTSSRRTEKKATSASKQKTIAKSVKDEENDPQAELSFADRLEEIRGNSSVEKETESDEQDPYTGDDDDVDDDEDGDADDEGNLEADGDDDDPDAVYADAVAALAAAESSSSAKSKSNLKSPDTTGKAVGRSALPLEDYSDSSEDELRNRVGAVPMQWYADHDHVGYDIDGKKIERSGPRPDQLDQFLSAADKKWTVYDPVEDREVELTARDRKLLRNIAAGRFPEPEFDPYEVFGDLGPVLQTPVIELPEPKSRFVPSAWEKKRVHWLATLMRRGELSVDGARPRRRRGPSRDVWAPAADAAAGPVYVPPPRLRLPGHAESYNAPPDTPTGPPPPPPDRALPFVPRQHAAMRHVAAYPAAVRERFERCLDIYLAPRKLQARQWVDDPRQLLPRLPPPRDLRPFPTTEQLRYEGHTRRVVALAVDATGAWLAAAADDGVLVWEVGTTRLLRRLPLQGAACVAWSPVAPVLAVGADSRLVLVHMDKPEGEEEGEDGSAWPGVQPGAVARVAWHRRGDYVAALSHSGGKTHVRVHQLSARRSQAPFAPSSTRLVDVAFHPTRPHFVVASQRHVRVYDLQKQALLKKIPAGARDVTCIALHPGGDHVLAGSFDRRTCWLDLDLPSRPYKLLRYHQGGIRAVCFHSRLPLFASSADDGTVHVFHARVASDLVTEPLIVPVKVLRGHEIVDEQGVLDCAFHPHQPWLFSAGADATVRLFI